MDNSAIRKFAGAARAYCTWAEGHPLSSEQEARTAIKLLVRLYNGATVLPARFGEHDAENVTHSDWVKVYRRFGALPFNYYGHIVNALSVPPEDPGVADLADDLADIWRDLKVGLQLFDAGHVDAAVWEWRNSFGTHWGLHAASGIYALHCWLMHMPTKTDSPSGHPD